MPPRKFFPFSSPVLEFPFGRVAPLLELTIQDEITFVMYYAPWCTRSMAVRWEFHKAAKFMQNRVSLFSFYFYNNWDIRVFLSYMKLSRKLPTILNFSKSGCVVLMSLALSVHVWTYNLLWGLCLWDCVLCCVHFIMILSLSIHHVSYRDVSRTSSHYGPTPPSMSRLKECNL